MRRTSIAVGIVLALVVTSASFAQKPEQSKKGTRSGMQALRDRFAKNSPAIGKPLPDVTVVDANGKKFAIKDLRGKHTVLVFGCLT